MIRYKRTETELLRAIEEHAPRWLEHARERTRRLKGSQSGRIASIWSQIKQVYTEIQHGKCAFCERQLGNHELASIEFDVEHFRPKNAVRPWPTKEIAQELRLPKGFPVSKGKGSGYRLLAYHHLNYASSCKTCNSRLKGSFFPIAGSHRFRGTDPRRLTEQEDPYLIYPLSDFDADPEDLIRFAGYVAMPAGKAGRSFERARVTIAFFRLNSERSDLYDQRARLLDHLRDKLLLVNKERSKKRREEIWADIQRLANEANPHAGCVRSFLRKYGNAATRAEAMEALELAHSYVQKLKPWPGSG